MLLRLPGGEHEEGVISSAGMVKFRHDLVNDIDITWHRPFTGVVRIVVVAHNRVNWISFIRSVAALVDVQDETGEFKFAICAAGFEDNSNVLSHSGIARIVGEENAARLSPTFLTIPGRKFSKSRAINACLKHPIFGKDDVVVLMDVDVALPRDLMVAVRRHTIPGEQVRGWHINSDCNRSLDISCNQGHYLRS